MNSGTSAMQKAADLMKLDAKGISPPALISIMQGQLHTALQHPGMVALVARRRERMRRLKDEIKNPGMHIKPEKPMAGPEGAESMGPPGMMPMAPGSPTPPSNHLGMFQPGMPGAAGGAAGGMPGAAGGAAGGMPGAPAGAGMQVAADILQRFAKRAVGKKPTVVAEEPKTESADDKKAAQVRAFKYGFFHKIAECGLLPTQFGERMRKRATRIVSSSAGVVGAAAGTAGARAIGGGLSRTGKTLKSLGKLGLVGPIALSLPILFGLGMATRHLTRPSYETPEELRSIERVALYKRLGREASSRARKLQQKRHVQLAARGEKTREPAVRVPRFKRSA